MSENTKIEWADISWNPWIGCTKVSPGCAHCYAEVQTFTNAMRHKGMELWGKGKPRHRTSAALWRQPVKWNRDAESTAETQRRRVFPSMCDWLDDEVPVEWLADFLRIIHDTPHLDWLLLTKRPENFGHRVNYAAAYLLAAKLPGGALAENWAKGTAPANVWIGTSVEDQKRANERILPLLKIPAALRFISVEPLLGPVALNSIVTPDAALHFSALEKGALVPAHVDWVIVGGESGPKARPCGVEWVRQVVADCKGAGVACFVKQLGSVIHERNDAGFDGENPCEWPMGTGTQALIEEGNECQGDPVRVRTLHKKGGDMFEWPEDLRVREFPSVEAAR